MTSVPVLKITITDALTGVTYTDSLHRVIGVNIDAINLICTVKIGIYANESTLTAGKSPIVYGDNGRAFYLFNFTLSEFVSVLSAPITDEEKDLNLSPPAYTSLRIIKHLQTLSPDRVPFDYFASSALIFVTI